MGSERYLCPEECQPVSLKTNQMFPAQRIKFKNPKTTDVFKLDMTGLWTAMHLLEGCLQADISNKTSLGSVATLTSDSPFAQAEDPTNHKNEKTTVTIKS